MANFQTSVDIANRALQHVGARRITSFSDNSKAASEIGFVYDKIREAELRRNVWVFSIRKAAIRPIDTTTSLLAPAAYSSVTTYAQGALVTLNGQTWESLTGTNLGSTPATDGSNWELYCGPRTIRKFALDATLTTSDVPYYSGELVLGNGTNDTTTVYRSLVSSNLDIPPTANWLSLGTVSTALSILYPFGAGPVTQSDTRNAFMLPAGYLRTAPQDPKAGNISYLGAPSGNTADDWEYENGMIVSRSTDLIVLRFAASITRVTAMDPMFCEGLACRAAIEVCEELTQSTEKLQGIGALYKQFMSEARDVNGIEQGPVESPEDDYIACRI